MAKKSSHPGFELQSILNTKNITQRDFAAKIGITLSLLNSILKGNRNINVNIAISLQAAGYGDAKWWLDKQIDFLIGQRQNDEVIIKKTDNIATWKEIEHIVPVNYFKKEGLLKNDISQDIDTVFEIYKVKDLSSLSNTIKNYSFKHFRKSSAFSETKENVIAWSKLAEFKAEKIKLKSFDKECELTLIDELKKCFYKNIDTVERTKKILNKFGIIFFPLDRPEKTPVDGKSFMSGNNPAIVLSLKYNRLDNFAFTVMHELGHVFKHFTQLKYKDDSFFVSTSNTEKEEFEADLYARNHLIDPEAWDDFIFSNSDYDDDVILKLSRNIKVHPGIIRGRICYMYPEYYSKRSVINKINILDS